MDKNTAQSERDLRFQAMRAMLRVDPLRMTEELIEHPQLIADAIDGLALAMRDKDRAQNLAKVIEAETADKLRRTLDADGKKRSEAAITSMMPMQPEIMEALEGLEECKLDVSHWSGLVDALRFKGSTLKRLAELTIAGYLSPHAAYEVKKEEVREARTKKRSAP